MVMSGRRYSCGRLLSLLERTWRSVQLSKSIGSIKQWGTTLKGNQTGLVEGLMGGIQYPEEWPCAVASSRLSTLQRGPFLRINVVVGYTLSNRVISVPEPETKSILLFESLALQCSYQGDLLFYGPDLDEAIYIYIYIYIIMLFTNVCLFPSCSYFGGWSFQTASVEIVLYLVWLFCSSADFWGLAHFPDLSCPFTNQRHCHGLMHSCGP